MWTIWKWPAFFGIKKHKKNLKKSCKKKKEINIKVLHDKLRQSWLLDVKAMHQKKKEKLCVGKMTQNL